MLAEVGSSQGGKPGYVVAGVTEGLEDVMLKHGGGR
jgi:hypothetical protein